MPEMLRVLILDDNSNDAELVVHELRKSGFDLKWTHAKTEAEYLARLDASFDVILSDYNMGSFSAPRALQLLKERGLEIPFIVVSGTIGEDTAVEMMRQGAVDYLLKDRLVRLIPAINGALKQQRAEMELRTTQAQLAQAAKMESIGRLSSGIAHDFNNYLSVIHGFAELARMHAKEDPKLTGQLDEILHASESGAALIQQLMAFSRQRPVAPQVFSMTETVSRMRGLLQQLVGGKVQVVMNLPPTSLLVRMDPTGIEQMLMNLATNARDAMKQDGVLTIGISRVAAGPEFLSAHSWATAGEYVCLSVSDTGPGMEPAVAERVFEPFFTTKQLGQGTGLGLAVVYGLVKQYDGYIEVDTAPGRGTSFHLYFPHHVERGAKQALPAAPADPGGPPAPERPRQRILVVDDEPGSLLLCQTILQEEYEVRTAPSGRQALEMLREGPADLLLTDIQMPVMDGVELIEAALRIQPGLKVAAMSAFMTKEREAQLSSLKCEIIQKPLSIGKLLELASRALKA